jgi:2'-5' RNA ligase
MRLFTALDLPADVVKNLEELLRRLKPRAKIQWTRPENLHITLKFIGEFPEERLDGLKQALGNVPRRGPIPVGIRRVGFYPNPHAPHSFWCGIEAPGIEALAADVESAAAAVGVEREKRPFSPHLTLARIRKQVPMQSLREGIVALPSLEFGEFLAHAFYLYRSVPSPGGSVYTKLSEFTLLPS